MEILKVLHNAVDYSFDAFDFTRDDFTVSYTVGEYIYIGYRKKFKDIYAELKTVGTSNVGIFEYYNGTSWVEIPGINDDTRSMKRSGFIKYDNPSDWAQIEVESNTLYFIRYSQDITESIEFAGINTVFATDYDLKERYNSIMDFLPEGSTSFISVHQSVNKEIVTNVRNSGKYKMSGCAIKNINVWDFHDRSELNDAAKLFALSQIFESVSDNVDGKFIQLSKSFKKQALEAINLFIMTLDKDDDGDLDTYEENSAIKVCRIVNI